jgi:phage terminase large subunit-like protein
VIRESQAVKLSGRHLRQHCLGLLERYPQIKLISVESNQGGDLWSEVFAGIPAVTIRQHNSTTSKEVRFAEGLEHWQAGNVQHARRFGTLEEQAVGFPNAAYDDVIDAAVQGVRYFLDKPVTVPVTTREESYV